MKTQKTKKELIVNESVYDALVDYIEQNQNRFYLWAYNHVKDQNTALDIVQSTVYKALTSINGLKNPAHMKTWFYRILYNTSMDELRVSSKILPMNPAELNEEKIIYGGQVSLEKSQWMEVAEGLDLYDALEKLEEKSKVIIKLRYFEDMKLTEIAEVLQESVSSVKSRLYRALAKMKVELEGEEWENEYK